MMWRLRLRHTHLILANKARSELIATELSSLHPMEGNTHKGGINPGVILPTGVRLASLSGRSSRGESRTAPIRRMTATTIGAGAEFLHDGLFEDLAGLGEGQQGLVDEFRVSEDEEGEFADEVVMHS